MLLFWLNINVTSTVDETQLTGGKGFIWVLLLSHTVHHRGERVRVGTQAGAWSRERGEVTC